MKKIVLAMVFVLLAGAMAAQAQSVPPLVNYQGLLTDAAGKPQTGTKKLEFNLYDAATGGNKVWGPQVFETVPLVNGMFNVILGTTDAGGKSIADAFSAKDRYLGMKVDSGTELVPRQQILSTPFAIRALHGDPVGSIQAYYGTTDPDGWLICDGRSTPTGSEYNALRALVGDKIPDLRGMFLRGLNNGRNDGKGDTDDSSSCNERRGSHVGWA
jgi:hypothetical protein